MKRKSWNKGKLCRWEDAKAGDHKRRQKQVSLRDEREKRRFNQVKRKGLERGGVVESRRRGENKGQRHIAWGAKTEGEVGRGRKYSDSNTSYMLTARRIKPSAPFWCSKSMTLNLHPIFQPYFSNSIPRVYLSFGDILWPFPPLCPWRL